MPNLSIQARRLSSAAVVAWEIRPESVCAGYVIQFYSCRKNGFSDGCTCERSNVCSSTQPNL
uniref:Uncharacterized protein n=1 Tax=Physcomitrium patens TaxID=3218 RepID=A0A7I4B2W9_PHYPA